MVIVMTEFGKYGLYSYGVWLDILDKKCSNDNELLYLLDFDGDERYLIIGNGDAEYAELHKAYFSEKQAKEVFKMM